MVPAPMRDGFRALARVAPYLLCRNGVLPRIDETHAAFALGEDGAVVLLMDDANEVTVPIDFPVTHELPPSEAFRHAVMCAYAPFN